MRRLPSFLALRAFEAAARLGSFAQAAEALNLTASAISHQVRALEEHFGVALFVRLSRRVELTDEGARLLGRLSPAFDAIEAACAAVGRAARPEVLAVHCAPSLASKWLGPRLPDFLRRHGEISLHLTASADPVDLTRHEELDLVIAYGAAPARRGVRAEPLGEEAVLALAAPALAARGLDGAVLIDSAVSPVRWSDWFRANGLPEPQGGARPSFDRGALAVSAAAQGLGAALESARFAADELRRGDLVAIGAEVRRVLHFLCWREGAAPKRVVLFREWLLRQAASDEI